MTVTYITEVQGEHDIDYAIIRLTPDVLRFYQQLWTDIEQVPGLHDPRGYFHIQKDDEPGAQVIWVKRTGDLDELLDRMLPTIIGSTDEACFHDSLTIRSTLELPPDCAAALFAGQRLDPADPHLVRCADQMVHMSRMGVWWSAAYKAVTLETADFDHDELFDRVAAPAVPA